MIKSLDSLSRDNNNNTRRMLSTVGERELRLHSESHVLRCLLRSLSTYIHVLMRDEEKKCAASGGTRLHSESHVLRCLLRSLSTYIHVLMRDEEKKRAASGGTRTHDTLHSR